MLQVLAYLVLVSVSTFSAGLLVWKAACLLYPKTEAPALPTAAALCLFGMAGQVLLASWWVLAFPLTVAASAFLMLLPLAGLAFKEVRRLAMEALRPGAGHSRILVAAYALFAIGIVLKAASPTEIFDDGIAHLPVIASIRQAGTVIGLANLHPNFGYNTHSTLAQSLYGLDWACGSPLYAFNAWLAVVCGWILVSGLSGRAANPDLFSVGFALLPFFVLRSQMTGLSTDPGHYLLAWVVLGRWVADDASRKGPQGLLWFAWMVGLAITFKVNALPLLVLSVAWAWANRQQPRRVAGGLGALALFLIPWLVRNVLLTGYLFLLAPATAVPGTDWRVPRQVLDRLAEQVSGEVFHSGVRWSAGYWQSWVAEAGALNAVFIGLAVLGLAVLAVRAFREKGLWPVLITLATGLGLWLITVTEPRYAHAWTMPAAMLAVGYLATGSGAMVLRAGQAVAYGAVAALALFNLSKSVREFGHWPETVVAQAPRPAVLWEKQFLQGRPVYLPTEFATRADDRLRIAPGRAYEVENNLCGCWNTPFPCLYRKEDLRHLRWRGNTLRDGFRSVIPSE